MQYRMDSDLAIEDGDSNEVVTAKILLQLSRKLDGVSDEMSIEQIDLSNLASEGASHAVEVLDAREE